MIPIVFSPCELLAGWWALPDLLSGKLPHEAITGVGSEAAETSNFQDTHPPFGPLSTGQLPEPDSFSQYYPKPCFVIYFYWQVKPFLFINNDCSIWKSFSASFLFWLHSLLSFSHLYQPVWVCFESCIFESLNWTALQVLSPPGLILSGVTYLYGQGQRVVANRRSFQKLANRGRVQKLKCLFPKKEIQRGGRWPNYYVFCTSPSKCWEV